MKKLFASLALSLAAVSASAWDFSLVGGRDYSTLDRNYGGVTLGHSLGPVRVAAGYHRTTGGMNNQDRLGVSLGYDLVKLGPVTVTPNLGLAYLHNQRSSDGSAVTLGVAASVPVVKKVDLVVDWSRQWGQSRVGSSDGNRLSLGIRHTF